MTNVEKNFKEEVLESEKITIVDFWAPWCGPCKMFIPIFENAESKYENIKFCKFNVDLDEEDISREYGIMSIPSILIFKDGKEIKRHIGFMNEIELEEFLEEV